jgi:DNA-binding transcriptional ArsR family regulator
MALSTLIMGRANLAAIIRLIRHRFLTAAGSGAGTSAIFGERYLKRLLWYLLGGTRGGPTRAQILKTLEERPLNANQLAEKLAVDYKTIQHHLRVLEENGLVAPSQKGAYGAMIFLTPKMEEALPFLEEIWSKIGRTKISTPSKEAR